MFFFWLYLNICVSCKGTHIRWRKFKFQSGVTWMQRAGCPQAMCPSDTRVTVTESEGEGTQRGLRELPPGEWPAPLGAPKAGRGGTMQDESVGQAFRGSDARMRVGGTPVHQAGSE